MSVSLLLESVQDLVIPLAISHICSLPYANIQKNMKYESYAVLYYISLRECSQNAIKRQYGYRMIGI